MSGSPQKTQCERGSDVIVVGGGFPGVCAAAAASRAGVDTIEQKRGHGTGGWSEYRRSCDGGRTWSEPFVLDYSQEKNSRRRLLFS